MTKILAVDGGSNTALFNRLEIIPLTGDGEVHNTINFLNSIPILDCKNKREKVAGLKVIFIAKLSF